MGVGTHTITSTNGTREDYETNKQKKYSCYKYMYVAETSLSFPKAKSVINFGLQKIKNHDIDNNCSSLRVEWSLNDQNIQR